jgi:hypothetical protein
MKGDVDNLVETLSRSGLAREHVRELLDVVAGFEEIGRHMRPFPRGQFGPDGIVVHSVFDRDRLQGLHKILEHPRIDFVEIFPRGIPIPDVFSARIGLR